MYKVLPNGRTIDCNIDNVIYLITCNECGIQYVGETGRVVRSRLSEHKNGISGNHKGCKILYSHFKHGCKTFNIHIIEAIFDSKDKAKNLENRQKREDFWIRELKTKYPYGLNDKLHNENTSTSIFRQMNSKPILHPKKRGKNKPRSQKLIRPHPNIYIMSVHKNFATNRKETRRKIIKEILSANKSWVKWLSIFICNRVRNPIDDMIRDLCSAKFNLNPEIITKKKKPMFLINHSCKWIGNVNFHTIFNSKNATDNWPEHKDDKFSKPMVIFSYNKKSSSIFFNYRQTLEKLNINEWYKNLNSHTCDCSNSTFKDSYHGHIVTGDMDIVDDVDVKNC